ncbi:MAG: hypothetical protein G01um101448_476 [Parcubacteria group bacterium Gr01-1014_48]|nr:MAG: hypothetical protein Greene041614_696 [Parcubacteria group bacterium Greene0416_14]TSC73867.1 MAG: hypothetical protein G01um101448_476 [Parcubacteria group bacterium Gr01-1014_48]TSD01564.1 MAG: hypothetical protein Greene101415_144 [Parcubacteria group bacterium Greene1014_15]TSD08136.1 MAG: hypothetical protein Greene07144_371 [Parcubacteria group bacterium Greene0714_4]
MLLFDDSETEFDRNELDNLREACILTTNSVARCKNCPGHVFNLMVFCTTCGFKNHGFDEEIFRIATSISIEGVLKKCNNDPPWHRVHDDRQKFCSHCGKDLRSSEEQGDDIDEFLADFRKELI